MLTRHITCITKANGNHENPHTAIEKLGFTDTSGRYTTPRLEMYTFLTNGGKAYVKDRSGNVAYVGTAVTNLGTKYVRTYADSTWTDNLLTLPEC
jgi:hypothetical protein